jgi:CBS domain containing-hemolysin-like protein
MEPGFADSAMRVLAVLIIVFANGFFVASEFALVTVRTTRIDQLVAEGRQSARTVRRALAEPDKYLAAAQLGITMSSLALGWIGEPALAHLLEPAFQSLPTTLRLISAHSVAVAIAFLVITSLHIVLGEQVPKILALQYSEAVALHTARLTELFMKSCWPLIATLNWITNRTLSGVGLKQFTGHSMAHSEEELKMLVTASQEAGVIEAQEEQMLHRVFGFGDLTAAHVMVPRTALVALPADADVATLLERISSSPADVLPVFRTNLDDIIGVVHLRHLVAPLHSASEALNLLDYVYEVPSVPLRTPASRLLSEMRRAVTHHVIVMDEFGGTAGIATFDDLMERIAGSAGNREDLKALRMTTLADGSAMVDGLMLVADLNDRFGLHLDARTYTTVGGYMLGRIGRRPEVGDHVDVEGRVLRVEALDGIRVAWVHLSTRRPLADGHPPLTTPP